MQLGSQLCRRLKLELEEEATWSPRDGSPYRLQRGQEGAKAPTVNYAEVDNLVKQLSLRPPESRLCGGILRAEATNIAALEALFAIDAAVLDSLLQQAVQSWTAGDVKCAALEKELLTELQARESATFEASLWQATLLSEQERAMSEAGALKATLWSERFAWLQKEKEVREEVDNFRQYCYDLKRQLHAAEESVRRCKAEDLKQQLHAAEKGVRQYGSAGHHGTASRQIGTADRKHFRKCSESKEAEKTVEVEKTQKDLQQTPLTLVGRLQDISLKVKLQKHQEAPELELQPSMRRAKLLPRLRGAAEQTWNAESHLLKPCSTRHSNELSRRDDFLNDCSSTASGSQSTRIECSSSTSEPQSSSRVYS